MDSTNTRLETLTKELQHLKTSLQFTQKEVDDIKKDKVQQTDRCNALQTDVFKVKKVLEEKFQINKDIEMERAHRTGKPGADRPRPRPDL